jgi:hypothetical protein
MAFHALGAHLSLLLPMCCAFAVVGAATFAGSRCVAASGQSLQNGQESTSILYRLRTRLADLTLLLDIIGFTALAILASFVTDTLTAAFAELEVDVPSVTRVALVSSNHMSVFCATVCVALVLKDCFVQCRAASTCTNIIVAIVGVCTSIMCLIVLALPYVSGTVRLGV